MKNYAKCSLNYEWTLEENQLTNEMFLHICKMKHWQADKKGSSQNTHINLQEIVQVLSHC